MKYIIGLFLYMIVVSIDAQDKILLMSGKVLEGKILEVDTSGVQYQYTKKGKTEQIHLDDYRIYSLEYETGETTIVYKQDSAVDRTYTTQQMKAFVVGEQYGFEHFKGRNTILYSVVFSSVSAFAISNIFAAPVALIIGFTTLIPPPKKINPEDVINKKLLKEKYFLEGYKRVVRSKRLSRAIIAGAVGVVVGLVGSSNY